MSRTSFTTEPAATMVQYLNQDGLGEPHALGRALNLTHERVASTSPRSLQAAEQQLISGVVRILDAIDNPSVGSWISSRMVWSHAVRTYGKHHPVVEANARTLLSRGAYSRDRSGLGSAHAQRARMLYEQNGIPLKGEG